MAIVTDKQYHIDDAIKQRLDFFIERQKHNRDNLILIDGNEGDGKSTAVIGWAYYIAHTIGKPFTVDNVFFDLEEMTKFAAKTEGQVIVWDEAALGSMGEDWANKSQKLLIKTLMVARKKRHFWFFVIPRFHKLREYLVMDRAAALFHVYSPDGIERGSVAYYRQKSLQMMYDYIRRTRRRDYNKFVNFRAKYVLKGFVIDKEAYEKKKDEAINQLVGNLSSETTLSGDSRTLLIFKYRIGSFKGTSNKIKREMIGIGDRVLQDWARLDEKHPFLANFNPLVCKNIFNSAARSRSITPSGEGGGDE